GPNREQALARAGRNRVFRGALLDTGEATGHAFGHQSRVQRDLDQLDLRIRVRDLEAARQLVEIERYAERGDTRRPGEQQRVERLGERAALGRELDVDVDANLRPRAQHADVGDLGPAFVRLLRVRHVVGLLAAR